LPKKNPTDSESEEEGLEDYKKGGYHPVRLKEVYNGRYQIISKLGWGHFSTVWLANDKQNSTVYVALKIVKSAKNYAEAAQDEIKILRTIHAKDVENNKCVVHMVDDFSLTGPNGTHICMAFEVLGSNLLDLIKYYNYKGMPIKVVKSICKQILIGLEFLHNTCSVLHTDLKPENILLHHILPGLKKVAEKKTISKSKPRRE